MKRTQHHKIIRRFDEDGQPIVGVFLANAQRTAWLYASDYEAISEKYGLASWIFNSAGPGKPSYVRFKHQGEYVMVSRLILDAQPRTAVKHLDKDTLNLRSSNLFLDHGGGGCKKRRKPEASTLSRSQGSGASADVALLATPTWTGV